MAQNIPNSISRIINNLWWSLLTINCYNIRVLYVIIPFMTIYKELYFIQRAVFHTQIIWFLGFNCMPANFKLKRKNFKLIRLLMSKMIIMWMQKNDNIHDLIKMHKSDFSEFCPIMRMWFRITIIDLCTVYWLMLPHVPNLVSNVRRLCAWIEFNGIFS